MIRRAMVLVLLICAARAQAATTAAFDRPGGGARAAALGGHTVVLPDDDQALGQSPGRLVFAARSATAQYDRVDPDVDLWRGRVGVLFPLGKNLTEPLQTSHVSRNALGFALDVTHLTLIEGSTYGEAAITAGFGVAPMGILGLGVAGRYERATADAADVSGHAWGVDAGLSLELADHLAAAIALRNALGRAQFDGGDDEDRATELTIGLAATHHRLWQAEADYVFQHNTTSALSGGLEVHVVPGVLDLRAGVAREMDGVSTRTVASAGAGFTLQKLRLDYAFKNDPDGDLEAQHQLALTARF